MRSFVIGFRITRVVEAETPEAAQQWADWTLSGLRAMMPQVDPHPMGVIVVGPAGVDHIQVIEERETPLETDLGTIGWHSPTYRFPADDEGETKEPKR